MAIVVDTDGDGFFDDKKDGTFQSYFANFLYGPGNLLDAADFGSLLNITDETSDGKFDVNLT